MMRKQFWEIIKDDKSNSFEILGVSSDDSAFTNLTCEMQKAGMQVRCETVPCSSTTIPAGPIGFTEENGLMARLRREYAERTQN